ncbi:MAG: putative oxidoreductase [Bacillota bacterium]|nr:putative oxidoreductase [Bacillota bacterium]
MTKNRIPRRVILDLAVTLDGFIEGKNGEVDWCIMDPDMGFPDFLTQIDTILYGRKSYDLWGQYIPKDEDPDAEKEIWNLVHNKKKFVDLKQRLNLKLVDTKVFSSGVVQVIYHWNNHEKDHS